MWGKINDFCFKNKRTAETDFLNQLKRRNGEVNKAVTEAVTKIIADVNEKGDEAVLSYTLKFDGKVPDAIEVPRDEINDALTNADPFCRCPFKCHGEYF